MLNKDLINALSKIYTIDNSTYDFDKKIRIYKKPDNLTEKQINILEQSNFEVNKVEIYDHNEVVKELKNISENTPLEHIVSNLFIKAVASNFKRGIQPIFSYYFAKNMPPHDFSLFMRKGFKTTGDCRICGIKKNIWQNDSENIYDLYTGYCRLGGYTEILLDLQEVLTFEDITISNDEKNTFLKVIETIEKAPKSETPSELIKRLSKDKSLPGSNNTSRNWIMKCFAELGILKNKYDSNYSIINSFVNYEQKFEWELDMHKNSPARADVEFPISAWRGELGVNRNIVEKLLDNAY